MFTEVNTHYVILNVICNVVETRRLNMILMMMIFRGNALIQIHVKSAQTGQRARKYPIPYYGIISQAREFENSISGFFRHRYDNKGTYFAI